MLFFRIFQHLLPDSLAWRIQKRSTLWYIGDGHAIGDPGLLIGGVAAGRTIERFFEGLTALPTTIRTFIDLVYLDLFPGTTRELAEWEKQFGIQAAPIDADRILQIEAAWQETGGQSPSYIQGILQAAGFDVWVHEWWSSGPGPYVARDPHDYTTQPLIGTVQCGEALALCGEPTALCNNFLSNEPGYLVNRNLSPIAPPAVPSDAARWPYFLYFGGETFPDVAQVPASRRQEFERRILKMSPAHLWLVTLVEYTADS